MKTSKSSAVSVVEGTPLSPADLSNWFLVPAMGQNPWKASGTPAPEAKDNVLFHAMIGLALLSCSLRFIARRKAKGPEIKNPSPERYKLAVHVSTELNSQNYATLFIATDGMSKGLINASAFFDSHSERHASQKRTSHYFLNALMNVEKTLAVLTCSQWGPIDQWIGEILLAQPYTPDTQRVNAHQNLSFRAPNVYVLESAVCEAFLDDVGIPLETLLNPTNVFGAFLASAQKDKLVASRGLAELEALVLHTAIKKAHPEPPVDINSASAATKKSKKKSSSI